MKMRSSGGYAPWFFAALALHAAVVFAWSKVIDLRPDYGVAIGESIEMTLVEFAEPDAPMTEVPLSEPPPSPEPVAENIPPEPEPAPEMIEPAPEIPRPVATPPPPPPAPRQTVRRSASTETPKAQQAASRGGSRAPAGVRINAKPNYLRNPPPLYPAASRQAREEGVVMLTVAVTGQGRAGSVRLHRSSGFPRLDEAALSAVRDWKFSPARIGGIAVASEVQVPVRFRLQ